jgi:hypothetical protein
MNKAKADFAVEFDAQYACLHEYPDHQLGGLICCLLKKQ